MFKIGGLEFSRDSAEIYAYSCGFTDADCAAIGARMTAGDFERLRELYLVSACLAHFFFCFKRVFAAVVGVAWSLSNTVRQPNT